MNQLLGGGAMLFWVAVKAVLLFLTAVFGLRLGQRRTLAEMSTFDFVAAVATGAIVGRVPNANTTSYLAGAVTLVTIIMTHWVVSKLRYLEPVRGLFDHSPRLLVIDGRVLDRELHRSGLTRDDLYGVLRQHGITSLTEVRAVIFERRGKVSVIRHTDVADPQSELLHDILEKASAEA